MQPAEESGLRELATRLLPTKRSKPFEGGLAQAQLWPGQLPTDLPLTLPPLPGTRTVGSVVYTVAGESSAWTVVLDVPGTPADLLPRWESALTEQGWQPQDRAVLLGPQAGGFQTEFAHIPHQEPSPEIQAQLAQRRAGAPTHRLFCATAGSGSISLELTPQPGGPTMVRVEVDREGIGACWVQAELRESVAARLPRLTPPPTVLLLPAGGGGSDERWSSEATAMTDQPAAALEAHFAAQLAAAGWTRQAGHAADPLSWSAWTVPGDPAAQGFLYVRTTAAPDQRYLVVQLETAASAAGGGMSGIQFTNRIVGHSRRRQQGAPANLPPLAEPT